jgi:F5/8 type C domain
VLRTDTDPGELLPTEPAPRLPTRRAEPLTKAHPGDLICGECGDGNAPNRKFCHRCGHSLVNAAVAKWPWYRRVLPRRRGPKVLRAGTRIGHPSSSPVRRSIRGAAKFVRRTAWVVVLVAGLLTAAYPPLRTVVLNKVGIVKQDLAHAADKTLTPVRPVSIKASTQVIGHPGSAAFDEFNNTYWAAPWSPNAEPSVTVDLGKPTSLVKALITNGATQQYTSTDRPSIVNFAYSNQNPTRSPSPTRRNRRP